MQVSGHPALSKGIATSDPSKEYVLRRDFFASTRLNAEFLLWKRELGFNIHPSIPALARGSRVADLATGTAIWLLDLEPELPGSRLDGFDINLQQCPPAAWLPAGVKLREWDIFSRLPRELEAQYDVIHVRLLWLVVGNNDPSKLLANALKMLKPGGYIQWDDIDVFNARVETLNPKLDTERFAIVQQPADENGLQWIQSLSQSFEKAGFKEVKEYNYEPDITVAKYFQDMHLMLLEEMAMVTQSGLLKAQIYEGLDTATEEAAKGSALLFPKKVVVGRKPK